MSRRRQKKGRGAVNWVETRILHRRVDTAGVASWSGAMERIGREAGWRTDSDVFVYVEALNECALSRGRFGGEMAREPVKPFEGRLFDGDTEARWRLSRSGEWSAWIVREAGDGEIARRRDRRYYLRGVYDEGRTVFREARYPVDFHYPVEGAQRGDRAYIEVAEYSRRGPDWSRLDDNDARAALEAPLLFAHRFFGVGAGRG